jgi:hypothetical protein
MARGRTSALRLVLSAAAQQTRERGQRSTPLAAGLVRRGRSLRWLAAGASPSAVAQAVGVHRTVVRHGAKRFLARRLAGRSEAPGRGAKGGVSPGGRDPRRALRQRAAGSGGSSPLPGGWYRTRAAAPHRWERGGSLGLHGAAAAGRSSPAALAPAAVAVPPAPTGCCLLGHRRRADGPLYRSPPRGGAGALPR